MNMARPILPDHAGRMPDHSRYGNPSDPAEESARIQKASDNLDKWAQRYGGEFSGGVTMSYGEPSAKSYHVPIGDPKIAQKIVSRPLPSVQEPPPLPPAPPQFWAWRLLNKIMGAFK